MDSRVSKTKWAKGPLPVGTWNWGGVVTRAISNENGHSKGGFFFADFQGDHAILVHDGSRVEAADILWWNNSIDMPPTER